MRYCDVAQAWHPASGGIKTYIQHKRRHVACETDDEHVLVVPGAWDALHEEQGGRLRTHVVASPPIPGCAPYRLLVRPARLAAILRAERPDVIEVDNPYLAPWVAFAHRALHPCAVTAFHHTDVPTAYVRPLVSRLAGSAAGRGASRAATRYLRAVYRRCDLVLAAATLFRRRLRRLGLGNVAEAALGVDPDTFHPDRRDPALRGALGAAPDELVLIYTGRLDVEKRTGVLLDAFRLLPEGLRARLVLVGEGPLRERAEACAARDPRIVVLRYQREREALAALLASSDFYVTAAPFETFGLSVLEAQACGLAVVGVRAGALVERVPAPLGVLATRDSAAALAQAIAAMADTDFRERGRLARRLLEHRYSWSAACGHLFALYRQAHARALAGRARRSLALAQPVIR